MVFEGKCYCTKAAFVGLRHGRGWLVVGLGGVAVNIEGQPF